MVQPSQAVGGQPYRVEVKTMRPLLIATQHLIEMLKYHMGLLRFINDRHVVMDEVCDQVLPTTVACLQVEKFCVGIPIR
jgi:hypothetical protein